MLEKCLNKINYLHTKQSMNKKASWKAERNHIDGFVLLFCVWIQ